jgi:hypothetical protein
MYDDFLAYVKENEVEAEEIFRTYYTEKAIEEGCDMQGDERYTLEAFTDDMSPEELYEEFAYCVDYSASYAGAAGVILEFTQELNDDTLDPNDVELQELVLDVLEQSVN